MMSTAFVRAVLRHFPDSRVDLIVKKGFENMPLPNRGKILPFDKKTESVLDFGKRLHVESYDLIYVLPPSFSSALMAFRAGIPERIGYEGSLRCMMLNRCKSYRQKHRTQHLVAEYLQLLDDNQTIRGNDPGLVISEQWIEDTLGNQFPDLPSSYLCIAPGVIYGPAKQWPIEYFEKLAEALVERGEEIVVVGTADDISLGDRLGKRGNKPVLNLCGKTNLVQLVAILAKSKALVSNDSGTMHVMAALQKPQVAIFGSTSTVWTGPLNQKAKVINLGVDCSPCFSRECRFGHYDCLRRISPELVLKRVLSALQER